MTPGAGILARRAQAAVRVLLASVFVCIVALLLLEVALRTTHFLGARPSWVQPDSTLGWRFTPNRSYWFLKENDHPIEGRINSLGWRDRERQQAKPNGVYRVAVLGDSYVAAFHVELDSTFLAIAERRLAGSLSVKVELMNFGRQGASQAEEYLILQSDVLPTDPDMVALLFIPQNDISDMAKETAEGLLRPFFSMSEGGGLIFDTGFASSREYKWKTWINPLKQRSALISLLAEQYTAFRKAQRHSRLSASGDVGRAGPGTARAAADTDGVAAERDGGTDARGAVVNLGVSPEYQDVQTRDSQAGIGGYLSLCTSRPDSLYLQNYELSKTLIRALARSCNDRGIAFLLICGDLATEPDDERRYAALDASFDPDFFDADLRRYAASLGIEYLGLQQPFRNAIRAAGRPLHWVHWNYAGHRVAAEALTRKMEDLLSEGPTGS